MAWPYLALSTYILTLKVYAKFLILTLLRGQRLFTNVHATRPKILASCTSLLPRPLKSSIICSFSLSLNREKHFLRQPQGFPVILDGTQIPLYLSWAKPSTFFFLETFRCHFSGWRFRFLERIDIPVPKSAIFSIWPLIHVGGFIPLLTSTNSTCRRRGRNNHEYFIN